MYQSRPSGRSHHRLQERYNDGRKGDKRRRSPPDWGKTRRKDENERSSPCFRFHTSSDGTTTVKNFKIVVFGGAVLFLIGIYILGLLQGSFMLEQEVDSNYSSQVSSTTWYSFIGRVITNDIDDDFDDEDDTTVGDFFRKLWRIFTGRIETDSCRFRSTCSSRRRNRIHPPVDVLFEAPSKLLLPKPVINVGFPKAGTSSIFAFFHCNGLRSQHWYCCEDQDHPAYTEHRMLMSACMLENIISRNRMNRVTSALVSSSSESKTSPFLFEGCGEFDVYTEINGPRNFIKYNKRTLLEDGQLLPSSQSIHEASRRIFFPQHFNLEDIHRQFPNATFILNQRPVDAWIKSVLTWNNHLEHQILNEFYSQDTSSHIFPDELFNPTSSRYLNSSSTFVMKNYSSNKDDMKASPSRSRAPGVDLSFEHTREALRIIHEYHVEHIKEFVRVHPSHTLIEIDITSQDAGKKLASSFGLHEECWGHFNRNVPKGGRRQNRSSSRNSRKRKRNHMHEKYSLNRNKRYPDRSVSMASTDKKSATRPRTKS